MMTRAQRIVLILYCLLVVYCCLWIPLHAFEVVNANGTVASTSIGYGWLWSADSEPPAIALVALRLLSATGLCGAAFLLAGKWRSP
jgi:TRAP-type C4-dicarboxylate transport system permease small subunit